MTDQPTKTVAHLLIEHGFMDALLPPENGFLSEIPAASNVGETALEAILAANEFAAKLDTHPDVRRGIGKALAFHIRILWFG